MPCIFFFSPARCLALTTRPGALKKYLTVHCLQKGGGGAGFRLGALGGTLRYA